MWLWVFQYLVKTIQINRKQRAKRLFTNERTKKKRLVSLETLKEGKYTYQIFFEYLKCKKKKKKRRNKVKMKTLEYVGGSVLDISKILIYEFFMII